MSGDWAEVKARAWLEKHVGHHPLCKQYVQTDGDACNLSALIFNLAALLREVRGLGVDDVLGAVIDGEGEA